MSKTEMLNPVAAPRALGCMQPYLAEAEEDWDYRTADTKQLTHGIHPYPAMMIPQVARRLIADYGRKGGLLFDPYCGSGTTLLEGMLAGMTSVGTDLNPLARLIARVKTRPLNIGALDDEIRRFPTRATDCALPPVPNVDYWFAPETQRALAAMRQHIDGISHAAIADVLRVAFSLTVRKSSWTRKSEFKLYRMPPCQMARHQPDPFAVMTQILASIRRALLALRRAASDDHTLPDVHDFNTVAGVPAKRIAPGAAALVVTSPPYGDSRTTVAYGQFSRLSSQWLGFAGANRVDNRLMGGGRSAQTAPFGFPKLDRVIAKIAARDARRASEVAGFFADYRASIANVARTIESGGFACYVVGNRTVKGCKVPTAESTAAFFEENGFTTIKICTRNIPNKRMPMMNSPSNVSGERGKTMTAEKIVICRKAA